MSSQQAINILKLAQAAHRQRQLDQAKALYQQALELDPQNAFALQGLGMLAAAAGETAQSAELLEQSVRARPDDAGFRINLGIAYRALKRLDEARGEFSRAIELSPSMARAHLNLGLTLRESGQLPEAERALARATQLDSQHAQTFAWHGMVLHELHRAAEAIVALERAVQLDPRDTRSLTILGIIFEQQKNYPAVIECVRKLIAIQPENPEHHVSLGTALNNAARFDEAADAFRAAISLDPFNLPARLALASNLARRALTAQAIDMLEETLRLHPDSHEARFDLALLKGETEPTPPPQRITRLFDEYSSFFDEHLQGLGYRAPELLFQVVRQAIGSDRKLDVLDIGCGTGRAAEVFAPIIRSIVGIDISQKMIEKSRQRNLYAELICGDIKPAMEMLDRTFDLAIALDVLIYIGDAAQTIHLVSQALRAEGLLGLTVEKHDGTGFVLRPSQRYAHSLDYVCNLARESELQRTLVQEISLREENGVMIPGQLILFRKQPA
jgi:predicted TPR repeat methyltransferase